MTNLVTHCRDGWRNVFLSLVAAILCIVPGAGIASSHGSLALRTPAAIHYIFHFYPRYERADCLFAVSIDGLPKGDPDAFGRMMSRFGDYLLVHAPAAAGYGYQGQGTPRAGGEEVYFSFLDECDEAPDIIRNGLRASHPSGPLEIDVRAWSATAGPPLPGSSGWLDSDDYDAAYWGFRKDVYGSCDSADWLALARENFEHERSGGKFIGYVYAVYARLLDPEIEVMAEVEDAEFDRRTRAWARDVAAAAYSTSPCAR